MKKIIATALLALGLLTPSIKADAYNPYIYGTQLGATMTFVNNLDVPGDGYAIYSSKTNKTCTADGGTGFWTNDHTSYTRMLVRFGTRFVWIYRYIYDGENIGVVVPPRTTVTVTCK